MMSLSTSPDSTAVAGEARAPSPTPRTGEPSGSVPLSVISLLAALLWLLGWALALEPVRAAGAVAWTLIGLGSAPWVRSPGLGTLERLGRTALSGLSILLLVGLVMLLPGWHHPLVAGLVLGVPAMAAHGAVLAAGLRTGRRPARHGGRVERGVTGRGEAPSHAGGTWTAPILLLVLGLCLTFGSALVHGRGDPVIGGLAAAIGIPFGLGLLALVVAVVLTLRRPAVLTGLTLVALSASLTLVPPLLYAGVRSQSTQKHIQLLETIREHGHIVTLVPAYADWPGFFAGTAWLCDLMGVSDPIWLARFWPFLIGLGKLATLGMLARRFLPARASAVVVLLVLLVDGIGLDYFSPQSVGYVLAFGAMALLVRPGRGPAGPVLLALTSCAVAVSHQLTPLLLLGLGILFGVARVARNRSAVAALTLPPLLWTGIHAETVRSYVGIGQAGRLANLAPPQTPSTPGLTRMAIVWMQSYGQALAIVLLGLVALVALVQQRRRRRAWVFAAAPAVGLVLVVANSYGNEGIFRAAAFGIPWLALLAASVRLPRRWPQPVLLAGFGALLVPVLLVSSFGMDAGSVMRDSDRAVFAEYSRRALAQPGRTVLFYGPGEHPDGTDLIDARVDNHPISELTGHPRPSEVYVDQRRPAASRVAEITPALVGYAGPDAGAVYVVVSPVTTAYAAEYGIQRPTDAAAMGGAFERSPCWSVVARERGTVLLRFVAARCPAGRQP